MSFLKKLSIKHEKFCIEYLKSNNATQAYRATYDTSKLASKSLNQCASRLLRNVNIRSRILEMTADLTNLTLLTLEKHLCNLEDIRNSAFREGKWSVAVQAEHLRGQACGFYVHKTEVTVPNGKSIGQQTVINLAGASDEEIDKYLLKIGLTGEGYDPNP